jgi:hypothetical protein
MTFLAFFRSKNETYIGEMIAEEVGELVGRMILLIMKENQLRKKLTEHYKTIHTIAQIEESGSIHAERMRSASQRSRKEGSRTCGGE